MTPLANRIVRELTLPEKRRTFVDNCGILPLMADAHCFEMTEVLGLAHDLAGGGEAFYSAAETTSFLPAPVTWVEFAHGGGRAGYLLSTDESGSVATIRVAIAIAGKLFVSIPGFLVLNLGPGVGSEYPLGVSPEFAEHTAGQPNVGIAVAGRCHAFLALINTPRIIGRRQHMPNWALERRLLKNRHPASLFPLRAWTEILLKVTPPKDMSGEPSTEAHLTGERALHFCRAHLRVRLGRLEVVSAHWRGNPAMGTKQSRYSVVP